MTAQLRNTLVILRGLILKTNYNYQMFRIRAAEEAIAAKYPEGKMRCPVHLSIGQEACAVGVCAALNKNDLMVSTHRGHAHMLAKGGSLNALISELYGKTSGCGRGQAGSMHLVDWDCGFAGSTSIVGGTIPVGVGLAFAKKLRGEDGCVVVCVGDAAVEEGVFHESANFASLHNLPVIFVLENNFYSCFTHIDDRQPTNRSFEDVAKAHDLLFRTLDGNCVERIAHVTKALVELRAPSLLVLETYRHLEHCGQANDDHLHYRDPVEVKNWMNHDPLKDVVLSGEEKAEITKEIAAAFKFAEESPFPSIHELGEYTHANHHGS